MAVTRKLGAIGLGIVLGLIVVAYFADISLSFNYAPLRHILIISFLGLPSVIVALTSIRAFIKQPFLVILLLGCGVLMFGVTQVATGFLTGVTYTNVSSSVFYLGMLIAAILHLLSALTFTFLGNISVKQIRAVSSAGYIGVFIVIASIILLATTDATPEFFSSTGTTMLSIWSRILIGTSYIAAAILFMLRYKLTRSGIIYWYALALIAIAINVYLLLINAPPDSLLAWLGRIAAYLGGFYFLVALFSFRSKPEYGGLPELWADTFRSDQKQFAALFANMFDGFIYTKIITNKAGKIVDCTFLYVNDSFEKIIGLKKEQIVGKRLSEVFPNPFDETTQNVIRQIELDSAKTPRQFETFLQPIGKWINVSVYSPKKGYLSVIFEDNTKRKKAEERLRQAQLKLEDYSKSLEFLVKERTRQLRDVERLATIGQVAGMVGHDIRNPLQAIINELYLVNQSIAEVPKDKIKQVTLESISIIQEQVEYIDKIVTDLQDYAKTLRPELVEANICQLIPEILKNASIPENVQTIITCKDVHELRVDVTFMRRILSNLISNALQAMPNGGKLIIKAFKEEDKAIITVEDTGIGISKDAKEKLFTPLFTTKPKGQGFGLIVVKRMTEALGGTINFESEVNKGTKFTITLPIKR